MRTFAIASALLFGALVLFIVGMFSGDGGLMLSIFCLWTPLSIFWGFSVGRLRLRLVVDNPIKDAKQTQLGVRHSRLAKG